MIIDRDTGAYAFFAALNSPLDKRILFVPLPSVFKNDTTMSEPFNQYETVFIMTPVLSDEQLKETVDKIKVILKKDGAEIILDDKWGLRKLAYPIQKKSTGFYHLLEFKGPGKVIRAVEAELKRDERIMRFLTVKLDKHAVAYNERKKLKGANKKKEVAQEVAQDEKAEKKVEKKAEKEVEQAS